MKIAMLASEGAPYIKSGGLGDVMEALPSALARIPGNEVVLILPYYKKILDNPKYEVEQVSQFYVSLGWRNQYAGVYQLKNREDGVQVYFIDSLYYFGAREGAIYGDIDDGERFAFFSKACLDTLVNLDFIPDVIQCNDWQTALVPTLLKAQYQPLLPDTKCVFTIHNVEYQGWAEGSFFDDVLALPWEWRPTLDMSGCVNMMKGAIETADMVSTVSETYAQELMYPYYAHGLDSVLAPAAWKLTGITNGIDTTVFDPAKSPNLPFHYTAKTMVEEKAKNKEKLQEELGLNKDPSAPLYVIVSRLAGHKGIDLLCYICHTLMSRPVQLAIVGTGEAQYEQALSSLAWQYGRAGGL